MCIRDRNDTRYSKKGEYPPNYPFFKNISPEKSRGYLKISTQIDRQAPHIPATAYRRTRKHRTVPSGQSFKSISPSGRSKPVSYTHLKTSSRNGKCPHWWKYWPYNRARPTSVRSDRRSASRSAVHRHYPCNRRRNPFYKRARSGQSIPESRCV